MLNSRHHWKSRRWPIGSWPKREPKDWDCLRSRTRRHNQTETRPEAAANRGSLFGPRHDVFGLFAAVAPIGAFVEVDELAVRRRQGEPHDLSAGRTDRRCRKS